MKKSLLIAPALGVLVLAAAGSVGGTVAWFSSNNKWDMSTSEFAITKLDGNLKAEISTGHGTRITDAVNRVVSLEQNAKLTHASFDHSAKKVFSGTHNSNEYTKQVGGLTYATSGETSESDFNNSWIAGKYTSVSTDDSNIYWAVTWNVTFTYAFPENNTAAGLYFNLKGGSAGSSADCTPDAGSLHTYLGFRIAMVGTDSSSGNTIKTKVWAPFATTSTYVKNVEDGNPVSSSYTAGDLIVSSDKKDANFIAENGTGKADSSELYCLGKFTGSANSESTLTYTFVAWFEGTDETNVVDAATLDTVAASLKFYTRLATATTPNP